MRAEMGEIVSCRPFVAELSTARIAVCRPNGRRGCGDHHGHPCSVGRSAWRQADVELCGKGGLGSRLTDSVLSTRTASTLKLQSTCPIFSIRFTSRSRPDRPNRVAEPDQTQCPGEWPELRRIEEESPVLSLSGRGRTWAEAPAPSLTCLTDPRRLESVTAERRFAWRTQSRDGSDASQIPAVRGLWLSNQEGPA
jgi:hypothetical protein